MLSNLIHHSQRQTGRLVTTQPANTSPNGSPKSPINRVLISESHEENPAEEFTRMKDKPVHPKAAPNGDTVSFSHKK